MHIVEVVYIVLYNMNALCCVSTIYGHGRKKVFDMLFSLYALKRCMPSLNISHWKHFEVFSNNLLLQLAQKKQQLNI